MRVCGNWKNLIKSKIEVGEKRMKVKLFIKNSRKASGVENLFVNIFKKPIVMIQACHFNKNVELFFRSSNMVASPFFHACYINIVLACIVLY